jgi:hypothetical protein
VRRLVPALALFLWGCPALEEERQPPPEPVVTPPPAPPEPDPGPQLQWQREGLTAQLRVAEMRARTPPELGYEPGTTPWQPWDRELPAMFGRPAAEEHQQWDTPGRLVGDLVGILGLADPLGENVWEITIRVLETGEAEAVATVLEWGFKDDAMAGRDLRIVLARGPGSWYVERVEERYHCRRAVSDGLCV